MLASTTSYLPGDLIPPCISTRVVLVDIHGNLAHVGFVYTRDTIGDVKETHTKHRPIRVEDELWAAFGRLVGVRNRTAVIRDFIRWYVRERGAKLPRRPGLPTRPQRMANREEFVLTDSGMTATLEEVRPLTVKTGRLVLPPTVKAREITSGRTPSNPSPDSSDS